MTGRTGVNGGEEKGGRRGREKGGGESRPTVISESRRQCLSPRTVRLYQRNVNTALPCLRLAATGVAVRFRYIISGLMTSRSLRGRETVYVQGQRQGQPYGWRAGLAKNRM